MSGRILITTLPSPTAVAEAARQVASLHSEVTWLDADRFEVATAAAFRLASAYPVGDNVVEVAISPEAVQYAVCHVDGGDLLTADSIAESAATIMLDGAAERTGVPLSRGHITTVAPGVLRLSW